jgi:integrase
MNRDKLSNMAKRGMGSIYRRGRIWWIGYWRNGEPFYESSKSERKEDALRLLKLRQGEIVTGRFAGLAPERVTIAELLELVIADYADNDRRSIDDLKLRIEKQVRAYFGDLRAVDLTTGHALKFIQKRKADHITNGTINRELAILRRALNLGAQHDPPLVSRVIHIPRLKENNIRTGFLEEEQYRLLLAELPERLKLLLVIAYHTGVRKGELLRIRVEQIDLRHKQIRLNAGETKNDEGRVLPIYGEMGPLIAGALAARRQEAKRSKEFPSPWLFHDERGLPILSFYKAWSAACARANVPGQLFHDLRRSAVRNMERAGIPRSVAMKISGHKTEAVYRRYAIVSEQDIADAGARLEEASHKRNSSRTTTKTTTVRRREADAKLLSS